MEKSILSLYNDALIRGENRQLRELASKAIEEDWSGPKKPTRHTFLYIIKSLSSLITFSTFIK